MEDERIIELLFKRKESALIEIEIKYGGMYKQLMRNFVDLPEDVKECENDFLLAVWNSIPPNNPNSLPAYISRVARNIAINRLKYNKSKKRNASLTVALSELEECLPSTVREYDGDTERLGKIISKFLNDCDIEDRVLFVRRYFYCESVTEIAVRYGLKENTVSLKLFRMRKKLKKILQKEGAYEGD